MPERMRQLAVLLVVAALSVAAGNETQPPFQVVVNPANEVKTISRDELSKIFLRKVLAWRRWDGEATLPVDQKDGSAIRDAFILWVHKRSVLAVSHYWQQQALSGRGAPPPERSNDTQVMEYVADNPGAIGYVSLDARLQGVKTIQVTAE